MSGRGKSASSLALIDAMRAIAQEVQPVTVRGIGYRLFVAGLIPSMAKNETNKVSAQLVYARENGIIPWPWIVDEHREPERGRNTFADPTEFMRVARRSYRRDIWADQPACVEVWSEKGTVRGTLAPVLEEYALTLRVMHGYGSATVINDIAEMTAGMAKPLTILYVGDHDPSGMHMSEIDLPERIYRYGGDVEIIRVAITDTDMRSGLPMFEAKSTDTRFDWYIHRYGGDCCELDALRPDVLRRRLEDHVIARLDMAAWNHALEIEAAEQASMSEFFGSWTGISGQATKRSGA